MKPRLVEVAIAYPRRQGWNYPPASPCTRCGTYGNRVVEADGRKTIECDGCGKRLPIIFHT